MTQLIIKVKQIVKDDERPDFILIDGPTPRVGVRRSDGTTAIYRQRRLVLGLDANGNAEVDVEPGPLVVRLPYGPDRQRVYKVNVPKEGPANLADLIRDQAADTGDIVTPVQPATKDDIEALEEAKADKAHRHTTDDIDGLDDRIREVSPTPPAPPAPTIDIIPGLREELDGRAKTTHTHELRDVKELIKYLNHLIAETNKIPGLESEVDTLQRELDNISESFNLDPVYQAISNSRRIIAEGVQQQYSQATFDMYPGWEGTGWVQVKLATDHPESGSQWQPFLRWHARNQTITTTAKNCSGIRITEEKLVISEETYTTEEEKTNRTAWSTSAITNSADLIRIYVLNPQPDTVVLATSQPITSRY